MKDKDMIVLEKKYLADENYSLYHYQYNM